MNEYQDPVSAFGSIEEGTSPLQPYIDPSLFDTLDKKAQIELLTPAFDALTLAGVDYDLKVHDSETGKRYILLKNNKVVNIIAMDSNFTDRILELIKQSQE
ncbi:hypothetical protein [Psychrobacter jeotgali]|uniref:hypothetical protein n=1 Tax=Psychrobacter jeotgali TaxID=179010 RepID=UPI001918BD74|nr:hypothetical protein [Psychrobacter jeotgali]